MLRYGLGKYSYHGLRDVYYLSRDLPGHFVIFSLLNLGTLCAVAFSRERENGTETMMRRINPDWRVAAATKFGYAFLTTLVLVLIFGLISMTFDWYARSPVGSSFLRFCCSWSTRASDAHSFAVLAAAACWGIFWTGRLRRRFDSVFLAFFTPTVLTIGVVWACYRLDWDNYAPTIIFNIVACLLALIFAPFPRRFGYRQR